MLLWFVIIYWIVSVAIGIYAAKWVHNSRDFAVAGRRMPMYIVTATVLATWFGSETVLGIPATFMKEGFSGIIADPFGSSLCLILAAFAPTLTLAMALLLVRAALSQMDVPTRSSYVMAVVTEAERAAAASFTSVPRSLAAAASPALAGVLFAASLRAWPLLICGALKISYDLLLLMQFRHLKPPEER